jgi:hypothetical protein
MDDWLGWLQWPAMVVSVVAAFLVGSTAAGRRKAGFWVFLFSNLLWIAWGVPAQAYALVCLQVALGVMNVRGMRKNEKEQRKEEGDGSPGSQAGVRPG